ncbi:hypothetical protein R3I94_003891 [Phoxinus phoxinus]
MMMVALMCVCALLSVFLFGLFQVLKHSSRRNSGSAPRRRTISNPVQDAYQGIMLPDSSKAQSENEEFYRPINLDYKNTEAVDADSDYIDVVSAQTQDQIYTELNASRWSHVYQSITADSAQEEPIYHTIDH